MTTRLVLSALGGDRPGIVDELSSIVYSHKLNIEDSRMTVLGGEFAILLLVSGEESDIAAFSGQLARLQETLKMQLMVKETHPPESDTRAIPYQVEVSALDHPGIVHNLTRFFSQKGFNILNLQTDHSPAPHTGTPMFSMQMTVNLPADTPIAALRDEFTRFCDDLNLDAELKRP